MCSVTIASRSGPIPLPARLWQSGLRRYQRTPEGHQPCNRRLLQAIMSASHGKSDVELFVLSGREAPELKELVHLPSGMHLLSTGRQDVELKDWSKSDWEKVQVLLKCGTGKDASSKQELQDIWPHLTNLKWIHSASAGVEKLLFPELVKSSVTVTNAKGAYSHSLAEWALTACSWFAKDLPRLKRQQKDRNWEPYYVEELRGKTLGIVGYGDIGQETANVARAFKMNIVALRRRKELSQHDKDLHLKVYTPDKLNDLMAESDYVVTALPHTDKTEKLVSGEAISHMKKTAVFINIGRGQTVDEEALVKDATTYYLLETLCMNVTVALQEKKIRGAGLDVTYTEPLPIDSPLWDLDNVLLSPHCADRTTTFQAEAIQQFTELAKLYVEGKELFNVVDKATGY
ncbi:MAG: D-isomer specific 2-hydroxyacid dehydrogenase [Trebouxia sp. A1-2]|nr:MAG: D-isomer specific 2-hydroxyacid dehydrogenase [Trebouxia sp. A1-2]